MNLPAYSWQKAQLQTILRAAHTYRCWVSAIVGQLLSKESWWRGPLFEGISNLLVVPPPPVESFSLHLLPLG